MSDDRDPILVGWLLTAWFAWIALFLFGSWWAYTELGPRGMVFILLVGGVSFHIIYQRSEGLRP